MSENVEAVKYEISEAEDWICQSDYSVSPKKVKSLPVSETDELDVSHSQPKRARRRRRNTQEDSPEKSSAKQFEIVEIGTNIQNSDRKFKLEQIEDSESNDPLDDNLHQDRRQALPQNAQWEFFSGNQVTPQHEKLKVNNIEEVPVSQTLETPIHPKGMGMRQPMPYKVVRTIENGKVCLSVVPKNWEKEGILSWPPKSETMLHENSVPGKNWSTYPCIVERTCDTYKEARLELKAMANVTDTEEEVRTEVIKIEQQNDVLDLNNLMHVGGDSTAIVTPITLTTSETIMADNISVNDIKTSFLLKKDVEEVMKNQAKILEILQDVQNTQKIIMQQLAKHEVQYNGLLNKMTEYSVTTTGTNREVSIEERFPPLKTVEELHQLEDNLKNPEFRSKYLKSMSTLCSLGFGAKGTNVCYKIIDYFFSRELLTLVSWSGNSRHQNEKVPFKFFTLTRQMFFSVIHNADPTISQLETDNFIKTIIKNSRQRFQATLKPVSMSPPKKFKKRSYNVKSQNDAVDSNIEPAADEEVQQATGNADELSNN